jgi:hypothetical protein
MSVQSQNANSLENVCPVTKRKLLLRPQIYVPIIAFLSPSRNWPRVEEQDVIVKEAISSEAISIFE